jgi:hypothetical protein
MHAAAEVVTHFTHRSLIIQLQTSSPAKAPPKGSKAKAHPDVDAVAKKVSRTRLIFTSFQMGEAEVRADSGTFPILF